MFFILSLLNRQIVSAVLVASRRSFESGIVSVGSGGSFAISNGTINWRDRLITTFAFYLHSLCLLFTFYLYSIYLVIPFCYKFYVHWINPFFKKLKRDKTRQTPCSRLLAYANMLKFTSSAEEVVSWSLQLYQRKTPTQVFPCVFCEFYKNIFLIEHIQWLLLHMSD